MVAPATKMPTIAEFVAANPNAPPAEMLEVVIAQTKLMEAEAAALKQKNEEWVQDWRQSTEVQLDDKFNFVPKTLAQLRRMATTYANSGYVPDHYKGNVENTLIAIQMALRCRVDIMTFLQSSYTVYEKPGIEGKLVIAMLNCSGQIKGRVQFRPEYDDGKIVACTAFVVDASSEEEVSHRVTWQEVVAEGWDKDKKGQKSKWITLPEVMFRYRSATFLARLNYPDVLMGMHTTEELEDIAPTDTNGHHAAASPTAPGGALAELSQEIGASLKPSKPRDKKPAGPQVETTVKPVENDPFPPSTPIDSKSDSGRTEPLAESVKQAPKATPKAPAVEKQAPKTAEPAKKAGPSADALRGFINLNYQDSPDVADFNTEMIIQDCVGISDWRKIIDAVISRKHPDFAQYLKAELQPKVAEEAVEDAGSDGSEVVSQEEPAGDDQEEPEFITDPVPRPELGEDAVEAEAEIIGKRNPEMIRGFLNARVAGEKNPFFNESEQAYLLSLGNRRAYQLEHNLPRTDRLPK